mgnify:CR=1 FL=1
MGLFFVGILLHQSHEEDEQDGGCGDTNYHRNDHEVSTDEGDDSDVSVADSDLGDDLVVDAGNEVIEVRVDPAVLEYRLPLYQHEYQGQVDVVEQENDC